MNPFVQTVGRAAIAATAGAVVIYLVADALGASMEASQPGSDGPEVVPLGLVIGQSLLLPIIGAGLAWLLARRTAKARTIYMWAAMALFVLTSLSALVNGDTAGTIVALLLIHVAVLAPTLLWVVPALPAPNGESAAG